MFEFRGQDRPDFAVEPGPGQESVWDYPRPPVAKPCSRLVEVRKGDTLIASSRRCYRLLETASPPGYYVPKGDVDWQHLKKLPGNSVCEWKGVAQYWALVSSPDTPAAWAYPRPRSRFSVLADYVSFYPAVLQCHVDGERVEAQPGRFYGGWITADVVGPFKGEPGTGHW